jgi:electron transport complex protein RnfB
MDNLSIIIISIITLSAIGAVSGVLLAYASEKFKVQVDPMVETILKLLPHANCGACGYPSCDALAHAMIEGKADAAACKVGGETTAKLIAEQIGKTSVEIKDKMTAHVFCGGDLDQSGRKFKYSGIPDCDAAILVNGGDKTCTYGCLGYGNCVRVCKFDAMRMSDKGLPIVDKEKCVACGKCIVACPRNIVGYIPKSAKVAIDCVSKDKGAYVRKICKVGCIKCTLCEKNCPTGAIGNSKELPKIDYKKCDNLMGCVKVCPQKTIIEV